jgi:MFS family permease
MIRTIKGAVQLLSEHRMRTFVVIWFGQVVSIIGSGLTGFALGVWVFQETGSVTYFALIMLSGTVPGILMAPFAGALVDSLGSAKCDDSERCRRSGNDSDHCGTSLF